MDAHQIPTPSNPLPYQPALVPMEQDGAIPPGDSRIEAQMMGPAASVTDMRLPPSTSFPPQPVVAPSSHGIRNVRTSCQFALREYLSLIRKRQRMDGSTTTLDLEERIRVQTGLLLGDLRVLREEVGTLVKAAEKHRWRRWLFGGILASLIPGVRSIFRRSSEDTEPDPSSNSTEYAFRRSQSLLVRIKESVTGRGDFGGLAFFVFAVLYVFQNEVSLRVAKTVSKRLKRLCSKLERGDQSVGEKDMKLLEGWRWRVLLWGH